MRNRKECWVTTALTPEECVNALILAKSLTRVLTSKHRVVLVSSTISPIFWNSLQNEFDCCIRLDEPLEQKCYETRKLYAKMFCWSLTKWSKIVFLDPNSLVVRNCDEVFETMSAESHRPNLEECSIFMAKPSAVDVYSMFQGETIAERKETFRKLMDSVGEVEQCFDDRYQQEFNLTQGICTDNVDEISIVRFRAVQPLQIFQRKEKVLGFVESIVMELWESIIMEPEVMKHLPTVSNINWNSLSQGLKSIEQPGYYEYSQNSVAIIGVSCRFPGANNLDEFWKLLIQGNDEMGKVPQGRWGPNRCPKVPSESEDFIGGFLKCPVDQFDAKFFGLSPMELSFMDPQQRLSLQVAWEALEDAGINPLSLRGNHASVFGGAWRQDFQQILENARIADGEFLRTYLGNSFGVITARISHYLGLTGPSVGTDSGCSSSMVAVHLASQSLLRHETDLSLAVGVNLILRPFDSNSMSSILAKDGRCKTFDVAADGFGRAEGCAVLVLKRYADAVKDGDPIHAIIRGSAVVQEGASRSLGTPTKYCEALAMKLALEEAEVEPNDVSFVETHGTGTPVGDPLEIAAIGKVYSKGRKKPLLIGSVKTNIGHTESCSGMAGIIKVILSMKNNLIPAHRNLTRLNPAIDLESIPAQIPTKPLEWKRHLNGKPRIAGISSFGITGTDAHLILQEPEVSQLSPFTTRYVNRPSHIMTLSAKTAPAFEETIRNIKIFLETTNECLEDIAYTLNTGRGAFPFRAAIVRSTKEQVSESLDQVKMIETPEKPPKICFLFTGQGSQYPGMAKDLYDHNPTFKVNFDLCHQLLSNEYGINIREAVWCEDAGMLSRSIFSQTAIFCIEFCLLKVWTSWGVKPHLVLGHSLGEFAAAVAAGILKFEDALRLVAERSRLIDGLPTGQMLVIKERLENVQKLLEECFPGSTKWLDIAAVNSPDQTVVAGSEEKIEEFSHHCNQLGIKTHVLAATHAFHSRHMEPILSEYREVASSVSYSSPNCHFVSGMEGHLVTSVNSDYWVRHTREKVRFIDASNAVLETGCQLFLEVGPQPVLSALTMMNSDPSYPLTCLPSLRKGQEDWSTILATLGELYCRGVQVDWKRFDQFTKAKKVRVPTYPFQGKPYWCDIREEGPQGIHALVGTSLSNPSNVQLFRKRLELNKTVGYLRDHVIGTKVIFPGAAYIEMSLVCGHAALNTRGRPSGPITLERLRIERPLALDEKEAVELQSVVSTQPTGETEITIYSKTVLDSETHKWIRHASSAFRPFAPVEAFKEATDALENIRRRCKKELFGLVDIYDKLFNTGLKFGARFQTLRKMWVGEEEALFEIEVGIEACDKYLVHPVVSDAIFQAIMIYLNPEAKELHVPVSVTLFTWFGPLETKTAFIHCQRQGTGAEDVTALLYDNQGHLVVGMEGACLLQTTTESILRALEAQKMSLPAMYENVWRNERLGPMERRADLEESFPQELFQDSLIQDLSKFNQMSEEDRIFTQKSNRLYALYMMKCLHDLGWLPVQGILYDFKALVKALNVKPELIKFFRYILVELTKEGVLGVTITGNDEKFHLVQSLPETEDILKSIQELYDEVERMSPSEVKIVSATGKQLAELLTGQSSALPILFPSEDTSEISAKSYYINVRFFKEAYNLLHTYNGHLFAHCGEYVQRTGNVIRILEVGAGTGSHTQTLIPHLKKNPASFEYTYTDISSVFFTKAEKFFEETGIRVFFEIFNIEKDGVSQGFIPNHYDIIIANNVIHATKEISKTVGNLRRLLRNGGLLLIFESIKAARNTNLVFGPLDGYWRFTDYQLRPHNCEISIDQWAKMLRTEGFQDVTSFPCLDNHLGLVVARAASEVQQPQSLICGEEVWLLFSEESCVISNYFQSELQRQGHSVVLVSRSHSYGQMGPCQYSIRTEEEADMDILFKSLNDESQLTVQAVIFLWGLNFQDSDTTLLTKPFLQLCKHLQRLEQPKLFVYTRGVASLGEGEVGHPAPSPLWAMTKSFKNEKPESKCRCVDLDDVDASVDKLKEAFSELVINDEEIYVAYRANKRHLCRLVEYKAESKALTFPSHSERWRVLLPSSKIIKDLKFIPMKRRTEPLQAEQIEVRVNAYGLNFRDVFAVLKPSAEFEQMNSIGIDFAGEVVSVGSNVKRHKVGDAVLGCNLKGDVAAPSHIVTREDLVIDIPPQMTFNEAATLPAVTSTAYISLIRIGKLEAKDTVLIHTGSGGVGLLAIQIAQYVGATIVATAGSKRKRAYLKSLGIKYIFDSRSTEYEREIRMALGERGVDVVLNSLTSAGYKEASLGVCNKGARFIEMSKWNTWTEAEVAALRPDVNYQIVDLSSCTEEEMKELMLEVQTLLGQSIIKPIPYVRFDMSDIREAFDYLQKAKHIGKIVCVMPQEEEIKCPLFNDRSSYLITGGLGGIGFQVAKWMCESGAKYITLVGRNGPNEKITQELERINSEGKKLVVAVQCDISELGECRRLIERLKAAGVPPLRGIMHAAGVLSDGMYANQSWEKYACAFNPKVQGAWNLHELTLEYPLEHFVMFSSASANLCTLGQSNHAAANFYLDSLAAYRNWKGLPATTINWGQWGQVGVAANIEVKGIKPFTTLQGISALEQLMKSQRLQTCVCEIEFGVLMKQLIPANARYIQELKVQLTSNQTLHGIEDKNNDQFWVDYDAAIDEGGRKAVLTRSIQNIVRGILKLDSGDFLNLDQSLETLGMDSLMMIELKNVLQSKLDTRATLPLNSVKNSSSVRRLVSTIYNLISMARTNEPEESFSRHQLIQLIREDSKLPLDIRATGQPCKPSEIRSILVTGGTGNLGPYIIRDVLKRSAISKVYVLLRPIRGLSAMDRLKQVLASKLLSAHIPMDRIECIEGSVTSHNLGMSDKKYAEVCQEVDAVIHLAVKSDLLDSYRKSEDEGSVRSVNVEGTLKILRFACQLKTKLVFHASSIIANGKVDTETKRLSEEWPAHEDFDEMPDLGYPISKFISERLIAESVQERNLRVKVFRFPVIGGDSGSGANVNYENNQLLLRMMSYLHLGFIPDLNFPLNMLPVDVCSELSLKLFFDEEAPQEVYNVYDPRPCNEAVLVDIGKEMGFRVCLVQMEEFLERLSGVEDSTLVHFLKEFTKGGKEETLQRLLKETPILKAWRCNPKEAFVSLKLSKMIEDYPENVESTLETLKRDLRFAKADGVFQKFRV